jgi:LacI family transcriptional regulator, fructose operon transcriptional repressor
MESGSPKHILGLCQGYSLFLCNTDENPEKEAIYLNLMRDENVAWVIFSPTRQTAVQFTSFNLSFPTVVVDRSVGDAEVDAAFRLTTHLLEQGYRRIAALCGEMSTTGRERFSGYAKALSAYDLPAAAEHVKFIQPRAEAGYAATLKLIDAIQRPDALLTTNSLLAAGALQAMRERNFSIPGDIALVTFDETTWASLVQPAITLIEQPTYKIGRTATELLLQRIADPGRPTRQVILKGRLVVRGSSATQQRAA